MPCPRPPNELKPEVRFELQLRPELQFSHFSAPALNGATRFLGLLAVISVLQKHQGLNPGILYIHYVCLFLSVQTIVLVEATLGVVVLTNMFKSCLNKIR